MNKPFLLARKSFRCCALALLACLFGSWAGAQTSMDLSAWLAQIHEASRQRAYAGTFVVSAQGQLSSARIWHACEGDQQVDRIESLTGAARATFRRQDQVVTFFPETRVVVSQTSEPQGLFPNMLPAHTASLAAFYRLKPSGRDRVAGFEADVTQLRPNDTLRFGYRVWTERQSGLLLKLQTLNAKATVLEQAAFSELQLGAPLSFNKLTQMMANTEGYRIEKPEMQKASPSAEGWVLKHAVPGFSSLSCIKRSISTAAPDAQAVSVLQWVFSDGLASVSLFIEPLDHRRLSLPVSHTEGATHTLTQVLGDWRLTAVGEVPLKTLVIFAQALERSK